MTATAVCKRCKRGISDTNWRRLCKPCRLVEENIDIYLATDGGVAFILGKMQNKLRTWGLTIEGVRNEEKKEETTIQTSETAGIP
jgi:hypothetical protein